MRINLDSDGVIYDLQGYMIALAEVFYGYKLEQPTQWYLEDAWKLSKEELERLWRTPGIFSLGQPYPGAIEAIVALTDAGHDVRIVTHKHGIGAQPHPMHEVVTFYREQRVLDRVDLVFARGDKTTYPADLVVDDKPNLAWAQDRAVNVLFDQPWNQDVPGAGKHPEYDYIYRAQDWRDVLEIVEQMGGGVLIDKGTKGSPIVI